MDFLPKTLITLMNVVDEHYSSFSWTSHEENGKMRISLLWNNGSTRRKSKATIRRDRRRYEHFRVEKSKSYNNTDNDESLECELTDCDSDETESDIANVMDTSEHLVNPCRAPSQVKIPERVENRSTKNCIVPSLTDSSRVSEKVRNKDDPKPVKELAISDGNIQKRPVELSSNPRVITDSKLKVKDNQQSVKETMTPNTSSAHSDNTLQRKVPRRSLEKVVMKVVDKEADYLLAMIPGTTKIVEHRISLNRTVIVDREANFTSWRTYNNNIGYDFDDVRTTKFMNDEVKNGILQMEQFVSRL